MRRFLTYLKEIRHCGTNTHNQRLAAIHALAVFIANRSPEHLAWCSEVRAVPFKKSARTVVNYLDKAEVDALVWRLSGALLDDRSHALRDGTAAGNGSDDLRGEAIIVVCHENREG